MPREQRPPFYFLERSVNILLVDDDPGILGVLEQSLQSVPLYSVHTAGSTRKSLTFLEPGERTHLCVFDLGLSDIKDDEFHLLREYNRLVPFVVLTGSTSAQKGFTCGKLGAKEVVQKGAGFDVHKFIRRVNHFALLHIINPRYQPYAKDSLSTSTTVLFDKSPEFVTDWAIEMSITDRELRYIWKKNLGANAKIIMFIYQVYRRAFAHFEKKLSQELQGRGGGEETPVVSGDTYRRMEEYYHLHRSTICDYLAYGNVVNVL